MSANGDIFAFESILPAAAVAVFTGQGLSAFTVTDNLELQRPRPRVEFDFVTGSAQGRWIYITIDPNTPAQPMETSWKGQFVLDVITAAEITIHAEYVANVRSLMYQMGGLINSAAPMTRHKLQPFFKESGTSPRWSPQQGVYQSRMIFDCDFSIQKDAWSAIGTVN